MMEPHSNEYSVGGEWKDGHTELLRARKRSGRAHGVVIFASGARGVGATGVIFLSRPANIRSGDERRVATGVEEIKAGHAPFVIARLGLPRR
ncbi:hypothetical protein JTE90_012897 [Oedothorax gibbosus]|uniref:Uncharacterized protein n=1 Tax=Oedothorax gibbosus TaxID=931172 RepID=A0AAV6U0N2_9ARAC|nr:hypothetical protein JTE90_012897 [Oedothorax gibbosus]